MTAAAAPVLAAHTWPTNGHLIADCARLGYLRADLATIDPTFGRGKWGTRWRPADLVVHDLYTVDGVDFRQLPHADGTFRQGVFDPPYVCKGGRETSTMPDFLDRYGLAAAPRTPAGLQAMNDAGLAELVRVLAPRSILLVKATDYVSSGRLVDGTGAARDKAKELDLTLVDRFEHVGYVRAQPKGRTRKARPGEESKDGRVPSRQHHARHNSSTLFVFRTPKRKAAA